ncbi:PDZ domain-containing protein [candidate division KSB1 bacterium]|nr:PDZ domain-containing protein [candidate division KSB1 bacterium]
MPSFNRTIFVCFFPVIQGLPLFAQSPLEYSLTLKNPAAHLLQVDLTVQANGKSMDFSLPAWAPGSYAIANYAKYVQEFSARDASGKKLAWEKIDKQTWRVSGYAAPQTLTISYRIYAATLSDTQSEFNDEHAHVFGPQVFLYPVNMKEQPVRLLIHRPSRWRIATGLEALNDSTFAARNYDVFIDAPFEIGEFDDERFEVAGAKFRLVVHGEREAWRRRELAEKLQKIAAEEIAMMGGAPLHEYVFCWHIDRRADYFGLEHLNSTCIGMPHRLGDQTAVGEEMQDYEGLTREDVDLDYAAHEFFHLWNVKRIRPIELGPFDYTREVYTTSLWLMEGVTDYYAYLTLIRCGLWSKKDWLQKYGNTISRYRRATGWKYRSAREMSWDAWLWAYGEGDQGNLRQTYFSYYPHGDLIGLCMDLRIRRDTKNTKSLDDVMRALQARFGYPKPGFTEEQFWQTVESVTGLKWDDFRRRYIAGREALPIDEHLSYAGIVAETASDTSASHLGLGVRDEQNHVIISSLTPNSPAVQAGLGAGDKLIAVNNEEMTFENWQDLLHKYKPGTTIALLISRRGQVKIITATLGKQPAHDFALSINADAPDEATQLREKWWKSSVK